MAHKLPSPLTAHGKLRDLASESALSLFFDGLARKRKSRSLGEALIVVGLSHLLQQRDMERQDVAADYSVLSPGDLYYRAIHFTTTILEWDWNTRFLCIWHQHYLLLSRLLSPYSLLLIDLLLSIPKQIGLPWNERISGGSTIQVSEYPLHLRRYIYDTTMDIKRKISTSVMEWIRIQVQYYFIRYFTNYFLTSLENCLVYIFCR